jgi:hypothetical protein
VFHYVGTGPNRSPNLDDIPRYLEMSGVMFELEYLAYSQQMSWGGYHEVSLHRIKGKWYVYDGASSPKFYLWTKKDFTVLNAFLSNIVYFKM